MQGRDQGNVPEEVSLISTQLAGRYGTVLIFNFTADSIHYLENSSLAVNTIMQSFPKVVLGESKEMSEDAILMDLSEIQREVFRNS